jgi:hypothetical protein
MYNIYNEYIYYMINTDRISSINQSYNKTQ